MPVENGTMEMLRADRREGWHRVLETVERHDFYHLPEYHELGYGEGKSGAVLFVYREGETTIAWPFVLRDVAELPGLEQIGRGFRDATSVYGYPGPVATADAGRVEGFLDRFSLALESACKDLGIVAMFSRLNPILMNQNIVGNRGTLQVKGNTVYVDLSAPPETQWARMRRTCRYDIRKGREEGITGYRDDAWKYYDEFIDLYRSAMDRLGASKELTFPRAYFLELKEALGTRLQLFVAEKAGGLVAGSLFVHTGGIIQYHLAAKNDRVRDRAAAKIIIDEARLWGNAVGARVLHLGGGVGVQTDGVFEFKASFSPLQCEFTVWKHVLMEAEYERFVNVRREWASSQGRQLPASEFFPLYRVDPV